MGEGNVSDVRRAVSETKPLAYTTVMTLLERLARKNVVSRRKNGRAYVYAPLVARDSLCRVAVREFVIIFFDGSERRLAEFLASTPEGNGATAPAVPESMDTSLL